VIQGNAVQKFELEKFKKKREGKQGHLNRGNYNPWKTFKNPRKEKRQLKAGIKAEERADGIENS